MVTHDVVVKRGFVMADDRKFKLSVTLRGGGVVHVEGYGERWAVKRSGEIQNGGLLYRTADFDVVIASPDEIVRIDRSLV